MATGAEPEIPDDMRKLCQRFERWRRGHPGRLPIPERLWMAAGKLARAHGVFRTAKLLRLEYGKLKRIAESTPPAARAAPSSATFLEFIPSQAVGLSECVVELEGPRGKMRIQWKGVTAPDLAGLSRVLWESA